MCKLYTITEMQTKQQLIDLWNKANGKKLPGFADLGTVPTLGALSAVGTGIAKGAQAFKEKFGNRAEVQASQEDRDRNNALAEDISNNIKVPTEKIGDILHEIEGGSGRYGLDGYVTQRKTQFPAGSKFKNFIYDVGYAKEYGLTPIALTQLIMDGTPKEEVIRKLKTSQGAKDLAVKYFMKDFSVKNPRVNDILEHYREKYMTPASPYYNSNKVKVAHADKIREIAQK